MENLCDQVFGEGCRYELRGNKTVPKLCPSRSNISKQFQTKPKIAWKIEIESTTCNHRIFGFSKNWSENPCVGSSILSLGIIISGTYEIFVGAFFCLNRHKNGHNPEPSLFKLSVIVLKFLEDRGTFTPRVVGVDYQHFTSYFHRQ